MKPRSPTHIGAVAVGLAVSYGPVFLFAFGLSLFVGLRLGEADLTREELNTRVLEKLAAPEILVPLFLIGLVSSAAGGFVAARMASSRPVHHAVLVGLVSMVIGAVASIPTTFSLYPLWFTVSSFLLTIPVSALGGSMASGGARTTTVQLQKRTESTTPRPPRGPGP